MMVSVCILHNMSSYIDINTTELRHFSEIVRKKLPKAFNYAAGHTLNDLAFGTREEGIHYINQTMIVRNKRFVESSMRVQRARFAAGIDRMQSIVGSIRRDRFTGWQEQITAAQIPRGRAITKAARGGSVLRRVAPKARLRPGSPFKSPRDYAGRSARERANTMMQTLDREGNRNPFILYGHRTLSSGLWKFGSGQKGKRKLIILQLFGRSARVRRDRWMDVATKRFIKSNPIGKIFERQAKRSLERLQK